MKERDVVKELRDALYSEGKTIAEFCIDNEISDNQFRTFISQKNRFYPIIEKYLKEYKEKKQNPGF